MAKAIILGATGLTGGYVLAMTLKEDFFEEIIVLSRREIGIKHPKLKTIITDFKTIPDVRADIVFSCLGTTKKKTPDPEVYRFIEIDIPVNVAAKTQGLSQFHYVSSMGAGPKGLGTYAKNKWEAEQKLSDAGVSSVYLYRPALIFGPRKEKRWLEDLSNKIFTAFDPLMEGKLLKYKRIHASTIAAAMIKNSKSPATGITIVESDAIQKLGR